MLRKLRPHKIPVSWGDLPPRPRAPDAFGLNLPIDLVIGYHRLAFLNQVRKLFQVPYQFSTKVMYKNDHISITIIRRKKNSLAKKIRLDYCASFVMELVNCEQYCVSKLVNLWMTISQKLKIWFFFHSYRLPIDNWDGTKIMLGKQVA